MGDLFRCELNILGALLAARDVPVWGLPGLTRMVTSGMSIGEAAEGGYRHLVAFVRA